MRFALSGKPRAVRGGGGLVGPQAPHGREACDHGAERVRDDVQDRVVLAFDDIAGSDLVEAPFRDLPERADRDPDRDDQEEGQKRMRRPCPESRGGGAPARARQAATRCTSSGDIRTSFS